MYSMNAYSSQQYRNKNFQPGNQHSIESKKKKQNDQKLLSIDSETKRTVRLTCQENFNQYLVNTTLHGLRYVGDRSITPFERYFTLPK